MLTMNDDKPPTCEQCRYCLLDDYGYSNYTVEGTTVRCLKRLHPSGDEGFDRWYGKDDRLLFAAQCEGFVEGEPVAVDVEREAGMYPRWWEAYVEDQERRDLIAGLGDA